MRYISEREATESYNELLDDAYPEVRIAGLTFQPSRIVAELDPIGWRQGYLDWLDAENLTDDISEADEESDEYDLDETDDYRTLADEATNPL
jgi:hypothetical protein